MPLAVGTPAPDFTLKSKNESGLVEVTLSDNFGHRPSVLLFFPAAFTGVCTQEMCDLSGGLHGFGENVAVYGISTDSPFAQEGWAKASNITVTLLSDYALKVTRAYDVVLEDLIGLGPAAARAAFVVDAAGTVVYSERTPTPLELPNFEAIRAVLAGL
ncbi:MAG: redoxin domain-containing protein [Fimbriimonas sp.]